MRWKWILPAAFCAGLIASFSHSASAQVAPAARIGGFPVYAGVGISRYYLGYGPGLYMEGAVAYGGIDLWHGIGIDGSARTIFMNTPLSLERMQQDTYLGGVHYNFHQYGLVRPFVRMAGGWGVAEFPSDNPAYTRDKFSVMAPSAGLDFRVVNHVYIRAEYEYQLWQDYLGPNYLKPQGWTIGAMYSWKNSRIRDHYVN